MKILIEESVLRQVLEALEDCMEYGVPTDIEQYGRAMSTLRSALAAAEVES